MRRLQVPTFTYPSWLPGLLSYSFLLVVNTTLPVITIISLDDVATGLEVALVVFNSLASVVIVGILFYKMVMGTCVFNDVKYDQKCLFVVAFLDICAAIMWSVRVDRAGFCKKAADNAGQCHTALVALALVFAWLSAGVAYCSGVCANRTKKKKFTLPIQMPTRNISDPIVIHAGQFSEFVPGEDTKFTEIPLRENRRAMV